MAVSCVLWTRSLRGSDEPFDALCPILEERVERRRPIPRRRTSSVLSGGWNVEDEVRDRDAKIGNVLTSTEPFADDGLFDRVDDLLVLEFRRYFDSVSNCSADLRVSLVSPRPDEVEWKNGHTVSITPDALGLPSTRIGFPSMYFDTFLSRGSRVLLKASAAAASNVLGLDRDSFKVYRSLPLAKPTWRISSRLQA